MSAVMYEEMRWVGSNDHVARSTPSATPAARGSGVGELETSKCLEHREWVDGRLEFLQPGGEWAEQHP